ncbi:MAG: hypothetical protein KKD44_23835 [Proteobacteria bacterium]|nr:hypothetical protein [Pseudomonadota bacterium]
MVIFDEMVTLHGQGEFENQFRIRIIKLNNSGSVTQLKNYYVVASDPGDSSGTFIQNAAQILIPMVCREHTINYYEMVWFEHRQTNEPTLTVVTPSAAKACCGSACSQMITLDRRPARPNEISHVKQFLSDLA